LIASPIAGMRLWQVKRIPKYLVYYRPLADGIEVVRVFAGARDLAAALADDE
jgi:plasmid stabilization system protein ParE